MERKLAKIRMTTKALTELLQKAGILREGDSLMTVAMTVEDIVLGELDLIYTNPGLPELREGFDIARTDDLR